MTAPVVAVLLSTYNGAAFLTEQLDSLARQRGVRVVLHARDDSSCDETCAELRSQAARWPDLAAIAPSPNIGVTRSFMELLRTAPEADFYAFCDQDDCWFEDKLAVAAQTLAGSEEPAMYCSNVMLADAALRPLGAAPVNSDIRFEHLLFENIAFGCTTVLDRAARDLVLEREPGQGAVMHDWWCALVVSAFGRLIYDPAPRLLYRQHGGNAVGQTLGRAAQIASEARRFLRDARSFYRPHAQAAEFEARWGERLAPEQRRLLRNFIASKASLPARARYALSGPVIRKRTLDALVARALILAGWY